MAGERDVDIDIYRRLVEHGVEEELARRIAQQMHQHTCNGCQHFVTQLSAEEQQRVVFGAQPALLVLALCRLFPVMTHAGQYAMRQTPGRCPLYGVDSVIEELAALRARLEVLEGGAAPQPQPALPEPVEPMDEAGEPDGAAGEAEE